MPTFVFTVENLAGARSNGLSEPDFVDPPQGKIFSKELDAYIHVSTATFEEPVRVVTYGLVRVEATEIPEFIIRVKNRSREHQTYMADRKINPLARQPRDRAARRAIRIINIAQAAANIEKDRGV